jgi:hypothetical protein
MAEEMCGTKRAAGTRNAGRDDAIIGFVKGRKNG